MSFTTCILCGTNDHATELYPRTYTSDDMNPHVFSARRQPDSVHDTILRCATCGLVYAKTLVEPEVLASLYHASRYTYDDTEQYIRRTYGRYLRKLLRGENRDPALLSYVDIGCGNGFMLAEAMTLGMTDVAGVEPSADAAAQASPSIRPRITQGMFTARLLGRTFDILTCFQALDHIQDPVSFLSECFAALRPGGSVLFINHNIASWTARVLGERCPMIDIEHTYLHTPHTMRLLFSRAGFEDISVFSVRNDYPLSYWLHLAPLPRACKLCLGRLLLILRMNDVVLPLRAGNLGLIARKPFHVSQQS